MTLTPGGVDRHRAGDGVLLLARPHGLGRQHHLLVADGGAADVHLAAADVDPVGGAVHHVHVEVRVGLLVGAQLAVALGVGDALGAAQVVAAHVVDVLVDALPVARVELGQLRRGGGEGQQDHAGGPQRHVTLAFGQQLGGAR